MEIPTRVAHAYWDEHAFRGHRVFADLLGQMSTSGLLVLALSGVRLNPDECAFIDELFVAVTFADPRIWPLKVSRIVGAYGGFVPAFAAGYLSVDGASVGPGPCSASSRSLRQVFEAIRGDVDDTDAVAEALRDQLAEGARLPGFGVPFRPKDERFAAVHRCAMARGRDREQYWRLLESVVTVVRREKRLEPNLAIALAAVVLDMGFDTEVLDAVIASFFLPAFLANSIEAATEPAPALRVLPIDCVEYGGRPARNSPLFAGKR
jgi:hypothetical protein